MTGGVGDQHARQWTDFHRSIVVTRRLEPGVFPIDIQVLVGGRRTGEIRLGHALVGVFPGCIAIGISIPGVGDIFLDQVVVERLRRLADIFVVR